MKRIKKLIGWVDGADVYPENGLKVLVLLSDDTMQFIELQHPQRPEYTTHLIQNNEHDENFSDEWDAKYNSDYVEYFYGTKEIYSETFRIEYYSHLPYYLPAIELEDIDALRATYSYIQDNPGYTVKKIDNNKYKIIFEGEN